MAGNRRELLTDELARNCLPGPKDYAIADTRTRGLFLRVQPAGAKSWIARRTIAGKHQRQFLGKVSSMSVDQARDALRAGRIRSRQRQRKSRLKFETFLVRYLSRMRRTWKPSSYRTTSCRLRAKCLPAFAGRAMIDITHAEIATWFFDCSRLYPGGANELLNYMRAMFNAARRWEYLPQNHQNPATGIRRNRPQRKAQLLNQPEVKRLLEAIENLPDRWPSEAAAIRMLLFTGCRRGEILNLSWDQVRDDRLLLSDSKTGPRTVILNADAREVIEAQVRRRSKGVALVFPRQRSANALEHLNAPWKEVKRQAKLPPTLRLHDLRHTFASHAVMGGTTLFVAGRLLGHKRAETTARYAHLLDDHLQEAAEKVAADLRRTMRPPAPPPAAAHVTASPGNNRPRRPSWQSETHDPEQISAAMAELNEFIATYKPPKKSQATGNPTNENLLPDISDICRSY